MFLTSFYATVIIPVSIPEKEMARKENDRPIIPYEHRHKNP